MKNNLVKIKFLEKFGDIKKGRVISAKKKDAIEYIKEGIAEYIKENKPSEQQKTKDVFQEFANVLVEDVKKFGKIDENGIISIDSGIQKQIIGKINNQENFDDFMLMEDFLYVTQTKRDGTEIKAVDIDKVTEYLTTRFNFKTIYGEKSESCYLYEDGIWVKKGRKKIKTEVEKLLRNYSRNNVVNEIFEKIKRKTAINQEKFDEIPINLICLNNGVLDLEKRKLLNFSPEFYFKGKIPICYDPHARPEKIINFIEEVCYPDDIPALQEFFGFCLYRRYFIKKAIILFGETDTGKTVLLNLLTKFIGEKNTAGISLQRIAGNDKFALSSLKDKYANIYDDLSADDLRDSGGFKIATGGGYITAEHKFGDAFQFLNHAKNIFATNKIPNLKDINDNAYYNRWMPICFDNQVEKENQDNFLFERITTQEEMSGLLNWSIEGLDRLLKNKKFSFDKTSFEIKMIMQRQNNPLIAFVDEVLQQRDGYKITKEIMFNVYSKWCQEKHVPRLSKEQLGRSLAKYTNYIIAKGGKERVWENVDFTEKYNTFW